MDKFSTANSPLACGVFRLSIMTAFRPPAEYLIINSTIVRRSPARQPCKRGAQDQAIGRSRGRLSTKIHLAVRGLGCPAGFVLTAGQKGDAPQASALLEAALAEFVIADAAFDADHSEKLRPKKAPKPSSPTIPRLRFRAPERSRPSFDDNGNTAFFDVAASSVCNRQCPGVAGPCYAGRCPLLGQVQRGRGSERNDRCRDIGDHVRAAGGIGHPAIDELPQRRDASRPGDSSRAKRSPQPRAGYAEQRSELGPPPGGLVPDSGLGEPRRGQSGNDLGGRQHTDADDQQWSNQCRHPADSGPGHSQLEQAANQIAVNIQGNELRDDRIIATPARCSTTPSISMIAI